jgi:hypothetical protein
MEKIKSIKLEVPFQQDGKEVVAVRIRKPTTGELRGLSLVNVLQMEVGTMLQLLPRIADPHLDESALEALDPADFTELSSQVTSFFLGSKAERLMT